MNNSDESPERSLDYSTLESLHKIYIGYKGAIDNKKYDILEESELQSLFEWFFLNLSVQIKDSKEFVDVILKTIPIMIKYINDGKTVYEYYNDINMDYFKTTDESLCKLMTMSKLTSIEMVTDWFILPNDIIEKLSGVFLDHFMRMYKGYFKKRELSNNTMETIKLGTNIDSDNISLYKYQEGVNIIFRCDVGSNINGVSIENYLSVLTIKLIKKIKDKYPRELTQKSDIKRKDISKEHLCEYCNIISRHLNSTQKFSDLNIRLDVHYSPSRFVPSYSLYPMPYQPSVITATPGTLEPDSLTMKLVSNR